MSSFLGESLPAAIIRIVIILLGAVCVAFLYMLFQFRGLNSVEAMDQAQLARNISEGKGYVTDNIPPLALWLLEKRGGDKKPELEAIPDLVNPPVYPFLLSAWLKVWGPKYEITQEKGEFDVYDGDTACAFFSCFWFVLGLLVLYGWTATMTDPKVATVVAALGLLSDYFWQWAISGTAWSFLFLLTTILGWLVYARIKSEGGGKAWMFSIGIGVVLGIGFLTRYTFLLWLIPVLIVIIAHGGRGQVRDAATVFGIAILIALPWCLRNLNLTGSPLALAGYSVYGATDLFPGPTLPNAYQPAFDEWTMKSAVKKWMTVARQMWETDIKLLGGNWVVCFFIASLAYIFRRTDLERMKFFIIYSILTFILILPVIWLPSAQGVTTQNIWSLLVPFFLVFGGLFFKVLLDRWELRANFVVNLVLVVFVALNSFGFVYALAGPNPPPYRYPPYFPPAIAKAAEFIKKEPVSIAGSDKKMREWMMSDMPWAVAWYGRRPAVGITFKLADLLKIHDNLKEFSAVFVTPISAHRDLIATLYTGELKEWLPIIVFHQVPKGFPLLGGFPMGPDFIVLTDPVRLQSQQPMPE